MGMLAGFLYGALSGVATMREAVLEQVEAGSEIRLLVLGVLVWLACSPVVRRERAPKQLPLPHSAGLSE